MKSSLLIRPSVLTDAVFIGQNMRSEDRRELEAQGFSDPVELLKKSFSITDECLTGCHNGNPMAMFGVYSEAILATRASVWFLGTPELDLYPFEMVNVSREYLDKKLKEYQVLYNHVDSRYHKAKRWLRLLGFKFIPDRDVVFNNIPFNYFELT